MGPLTRVLIWALVIGSSLYLIACVALYFGQTALVFFPFKDITATPGGVGVTYEEVTLNTEDGVRIHGWYAPHESARGTFLFFHGNAGNLSHRVHLFPIFHDLRVNTFMIDYRGFGRSEGELGEDGTYADARAAWRYLIETKGQSPESIIIFGRSLGGAVATHLTAELSESGSPPAGLILESTLTSVPDLGSSVYPYFPVRLLARLSYNNLDYITRIATPLLVTHSPYDEIIPYEFGRRVFEAAPEPKEFHDIAGGHNSATSADLTLYRSTLAAFIDRRLPVDSTADSNQED